jgi:hypothetical protein
VIKRRRIFPPFPEREIEFAHGWSTNLQLGVVPGRAVAVTRVELDDLIISSVFGVITATMTEVDSSYERNVTIKTGGMANEDQLLVVGSAPSHSLVKESFATRLGHLNGETSIFLRTKREAVAVRTPEQSSNVDAPSTRVRQKSHNRCPIAGYVLARVSSPIGEADFVVRPEARDSFSQSREIREPIDMERDVVALGPRNAFSAVRVDLGHGVAPLIRGEKPVVKTHHEPTY